MTKPSRIHHDVGLAAIACAGLLALACDAADGEVEARPTSEVVTHNGMTLSSRTTPDGSIETSVVGPDGTVHLSARWQSGTSVIETRVPNREPALLQLNVKAPTLWGMNGLAYYDYQQSLSFHAPGCDYVYDTVCNSPCCTAHDFCHSPECYNPLAPDSWQPNQACVDCQRTVRNCFVENTGCQRGNQGERRCETEPARFPCGCDTYTCATEDYSSAECRAGTWTNACARGPNDTPAVTCGDGVCSQVVQENCPQDCNDANGAGGTSNGAGGSGSSAGGASNGGNGWGAGGSSSGGSGWAGGSTGGENAGGSGWGGSPGSGGTGSAGEPGSGGSGWGGNGAGAAGGASWGGEPGAGGTGTSSYCGDGVCDEDCSSCPSDCGDCGYGGSF